MKNLVNPNDLAFMKMHGLGNDFVVIDSRGGNTVTTPELARALGDRHKGVGFDQLAEIRAGDKSDITLDFWNADGSVAGACGNATRCVAGYIMAQGNTDAITIRTARGVLQGVRDRDGIVSINMGMPQIAWQEIPLSHDVDPLHLPLSGIPVAVGMGNPHCVFFVDDVGAIDVAARGSEIENNSLFPEATNVEFAEILGDNDIRMRVWERGAGITLACGSGACATVVAARQRGLIGTGKIAVHLDGGRMELDWRSDGVWMTGPTAHVFSATLSAEFMDSI